MIRLLSALLALSLTLVTIAASEARGAMAAGAICGSPTALLIGADGLPLLADDGTPIEAPTCPDCLLVALSLSPPGAAPTPPVTLCPASTIAVVAPPAPRSPLRIRQARAPPAWPMLPA